MVAGEIVAGPPVRAACRRHLQDLEHGHERGLTWDVAEVERVIGFFRDVLTVEIERDDEYGEAVSESVPFELQPAQCFIVGSLFGWKNAQGLRRFRRAYVEMGKGNGKSPLAAGIGHYMLCATKKLRAEVYSAATDKDQAAILFRDAVEMWRRSPALLERLVPSGVNPIWQLTLLSTSSFFKPISSEKRGKSGIRPYCALVDEIHEHADNTVIEMLRAGTKGNRQALLFEITNSGHDRTSVCWSEHEYSVAVAHGEQDNDAWFSYVCALDEDDDPLNDESCWMKANPLLGVAIQPEYIREQVTEARGMPSKESMVLRLNFCVWTDAADGWVTRSAWEAIECDELALEDYQGDTCYGGLDLAYTTDLAAAAWVFPRVEEPEAEGEQAVIYLDAFVDFWKPREGLHAAVKKDRVPYDLWATNGHLNLTEGPVIKLGPIARRMAEIQDRCDLKFVAFDRYRHKDLENDLADLGFSIPMIEHPQGFRQQKANPLWMPASFQELENAIVEVRIRVKTSPVLRWNAASTVVRQDPAGTDNRIPDKRKSTGRIDGITALAMAVGASVGRVEDGDSVYETRGVLEIG